MVQTVRREASIDGTALLLTSLAGDGERGLTLGLLTLSELVVVDLRHVDSCSNRILGGIKCKIQVEGGFSEALMYVNLERKFG